MKRIQTCILMVVVLALPLFVQFAPSALFVQKAQAAESEVPQSIILNKIAAVVNGEIITLHELRQQAGAEFKRAGINPADPAMRRHVDTIMGRLLSTMIDDILLRQEAERLGIKVTDSEVDNEVRKIAQRNQTTLKDFEARVVAQGGSMAMVRESVSNSILSSRIIGLMIARKVVITEAEVKAYFEEHQGDFSAERSVDFSLIVLAPSVDADAINEQILNGKLSFEEAAKKHSEGPLPEKGGRLGMTPWDDLASPFKAQLMQLKDGEVSPPFSANGMICLVKLNGATSGRSMTLEEATPEIEQILREPRLQERFIEYTDQLRSRAVIDIRV